MLSVPYVDGLGAYLMDRVETGRGEVSSARLTVNNPLVADQVVIKGVYFEFAVGATDLTKAGTVGDPMLIDWGGGGINAAMNLRTALNDNVSLAPLMDLIVPLGLHVKAVLSAFGDYIDISAEDGTPADVTGPDGDLFTISTSNNVRLALTAAVIAAGTFLRTNPNWTTATLTSQVAAIMNLVDTGAAATLVALDGLLSTVGADLAGTTYAGSQSTGTLADVLSILAGRGYRIRQFHEITEVAHQYQNAGVWNPAVLGGFTQLVREWGGSWGHGEVRPATVGGDLVAHEISPIRHTVDTDSLQVSLASGHLAVFGAAAGMPPVTLWPDSDLTPHYPWTFQGSLQFPEVTSARVLTVYDDNGNVLV